MRCQSQWGGERLYYRCRAGELGYDCNQIGVPVEIADEQVVTILKSLKPPKDWRKGVTRAVGELLGERSLEERLQEIREIIKRMDTRWDHGLISNEEEYMQQRLELQQELEKLNPVPDDDLERAADLLEHFADHWENLKDNPEDQHELVNLIVERAYIDEDQIVAMTLKSNYHLVLGHKLNEPTEYTMDSSLYASGSDGSRPLTCTGSILFVPGHLRYQYGNNSNRITYRKAKFQS